MKKRQRFVMRVSVLSVIAVALTYTFYSSLFGENEAQIGVNDEAPNFVLEGLHGTSIQLEDYQGKGIFLNFWGTYCPPCEREMPYMENQYQAFQDRGVEVLAVNVGESSLPVQNFMDRHQLTFPIPMDRNSQVVDQYGIQPLPTTFLIDEKGIVVKVITGGMTEEDIRRYMEMIEPESSTT